MSITYTWGVENIDIIPNKDGYENIVYRVVWKCTAKTDAGEEKSQIGVVELNINNIESGFKPIEQVTQADVVSWVKQVVAVASVEAGLIPTVKTATFNEDGILVIPETPDTSVSPEPPGDTDDLNK
jgi:hypothetical protein